MLECVFSGIPEKVLENCFGGYRPMRKFVGGAKRSMSWKSFTAAFLVVITYVNKYSITYVNKYSGTSLNQPALGPKNMAGLEGRLVL
jgi:hypothetical protein